MERSELMLAALSCANGGLYTPVQLQKLFFLIDENIPGAIEGPLFTFEPFDYGPFDKEVYVGVSKLVDADLAQAIPQKTWTSYRLTEEGQRLGEEHLSQLDESVQNYIRELSSFVRSLSFSQLVSAIYKAYPEMKVNSVFNSAS